MEDWVFDNISGGEINYGSNSREFHEVYQKCHKGVLTKYSLKTVDRIDSIRFETKSFKCQAKSGLKPLCDKAHQEGNNN